MKIIENNHKQDSIEITCPHCNSKLSVEVSDIRYNEIVHNCSQFESTCEACGRPIGISQKQIPAGWVRFIAPDED